MSYSSWIVMNAKIVYQDGDYQKVLRGSYEQNNDFIEVIDSFGEKHLIGKRFIISISGGEYE